MPRLVQGAPEGQCEEHRLSRSSVQHQEPSQGHLLIQQPHQNLESTGEGRIQGSS